LLEQHLLIDTTTICWRLSDALLLDVAEFEQALAFAASAMRAGNVDAAAAALQQAVALYRGDLLPSCYCEWLFPPRERLHQLFIGALEQLLVYAEERRAYHDAIHYAKRLIQYEPLHETVYLALMRLQALCGDRAAALHTYQICSTLLGRELGAEPAQPLREIYTRLTLLEAAPAPAAGSQDEAQPLRAWGLVGRQHEWSRLLAIWADVAGGHPKAVILSGEAGVGKTRLAEELLRWAELQGFWTASARCYRSEGELSYAPAIQWLRSRPIFGAAKDLDAVWAGELARLVPELLAKRPDLPCLEPAGGPWQRQRLFEAMVRATSAISRPTVLLLDDLQWCDRATLEWLHYRLRYEPGGRFLLLATLRPDDLDPDDGATALLHELEAQSQVIEIQIEPLGEAETAALVAQVVGAPLSAMQAASWYRETEGNPLFVIELARSELRERQAGQHTADAPALPASEPRLPPRISGVISARLAKLSVLALQIAELAATIGREFTFDMLARAGVAKDEEALVQALDELWQRRIIREHGAQSYRFSHNKLREFLCQRLSDARRRLLHRRVAAASEALFLQQQTLIGAQAAPYE
jgi:hypothetical protein